VGAAGNGLRILVFVVVKLLIKGLLLEHAKDAEEQRPLHRRAFGAAGRSEDDLHVSKRKGRKLGSDDSNRIGEQV
jgi:hypothetical protein